MQGQSLRIFGQQQLHCLCCNCLWHLLTDHTGRLCSNLAAALDYAHVVHSLNVHTTAYYVHCNSGRPDLIRWGMNASDVEVAVLQAVAAARPAAAHVCAVPQCGTSRHTIPAHHSPSLGILPCSAHVHPGSVHQLHGLHLVSQPSCCTEFGYTAYSCSLLYCTACTAAFVPALHMHTCHSGLIFPRRCCHASPELCMTGSISI